MAIAASAQEMRSPTEISMSSSRGFGRDDISAPTSLVRRVAHRREDGDDALSCSRAATICFATVFRRSVSATDVPPNFMTSVLCEVFASPRLPGRLRTRSLPQPQ